VLEKYLIITYAIHFDLLDHVSQATDNLLQFLIASKNITLKIKVMIKTNWWGMLKENKKYKRNQPFIIKYDTEVCNE